MAPLLDRRNMKSLRGVKRHDTMLRKSFGIGYHQYRTMFEEQNGRCYICGDSEHRRNLAVDHNHVTGAPRRLLCTHCNSGLGFFRDNPEILRRAAVYVEHVYDLPPDVAVIMKPHKERPRWRTRVKTPLGQYNSFEEASVVYGVHPTTIGVWCGAYEKRMHLKKDGFIFERYFG